MSTGVTAVGDATSQQTEVMKYLDSHHVNDQLNVVVNKLVKAHSDDPFGFLSKEFLRLAKPPTVSKVRCTQASLLQSAAAPWV